MKDKEQVSRIDSSTSRIAEDLNILLRNMQSDIQYKLENRVSEMVNKIMFEKEERMRSQDEIRKNLDFRERLLMEKQRSEKEQLESRYLSMDSECGSTQPTSGTSSCARIKASRHYRTSLRQR